MYDCPACGAEDVADQAACRNCGAGLSLLLQLGQVADLWFNRALAELRNDAPNRGRALEWLSACCAARPTDAAARLAQAKIWAQLDCWPEAQDALDRAAKIEPEAPELNLIRQALQEAEANAGYRAPPARKVNKGGKKKRSRR